MALDVDVVVDGGVRGEEPSSRSWRLEPGLSSSLSSGRLFGDFSTNARWSTGDMPVGQPRPSQGCTTGTESVRHDRLGKMSLLLERHTHRLESRRPVPPRLHEDVEHLVPVVDGMPELAALARDPDEDLVEMPARRWPWPALADPGGTEPTERQHPAADGLVGDMGFALGQQVLDISVARGETEIQPHGALDDLGREPVTGVGNMGHPPDTGR